MVEAGWGNDKVIQVGGQGQNKMQIVGGDGDDHIKQYGGSGNNIMYVNPDVGDDVIEMYGGPGNNSMTYDVGAGNDLATILGGGGYNTLTINRNQQNFIVKDYTGRVLFQSGNGGTIITIANIQYTKVIGDSGENLWEYRADVNQDGVLDMKDAVLSMQVLAGVAPAQPGYKEADINGDGRIGLAEVIFILQAVAGIR